MSRNEIEKNLRSINMGQVQSLDEQITKGNGWEYYESAQITRATIFKNKISAEVGNFLETYQVKLSVHGQEISGSCTCGRARRLCKHMVALLYAWVQDGNDFTDVERQLDEITKMDKEDLVKIVSNIIRANPEYIELFMLKNIPEWDEIDPLS